MTTKVQTWGPPGDQWHYDHTTKHYDLCRGSDKRLTIATTAGPKETTISFAPELSALVIVDMQNFFLDSRLIDNLLGLKAIDPIISVIKKCREMGIQVIWLNWGLTNDDLANMTAAQRRISASLNNANDSGLMILGDDLGPPVGRLGMGGSWNCDIYPTLKEQVREDDIHCAKNRVSGLWNAEQPLRKHLVGAGKKTLLFAGTATDICVLSTIVSAYNAGWDCVMLDDCCATIHEGAKEVCVNNVSGTFGFVSDSKSFVGGKLEVRSDTNE